MVLHRGLAGRIKTVTISKEPCDHGYASVVTEDDALLPDPIMPEGGRQRCRIDRLCGNERRQPLPEPAPTCGRWRKNSHASNTTWRGSRRGSQSRDKARRGTRCCWWREDPAISASGSAPLVLLGPAKLEAATFRRGSVHMRCHQITSVTRGKGEQR